MNLFSSCPEWLRALAGVSTATVGLAWLATLFLRRQSAAWRHLVWLLALCAPLLTLPLGWLHPRVTIPILPRAAERKTVSGRVTEQPATRQPSDSPLTDAVAGVSPVHPIPALGLRSRLRLPGQPWTGTWLFGAVAVAVRLLLAHLHLRRLVRDSSSPAPPDLLRHLHDTKEAFQFGGKVRLRVGPLTTVPFCRGVLASTIHFPANWRRWDQERIRICLSHELAHLIRRDLLTLLVGQFACIFCWFNPLVWFAAARLRREAERSTDDLVLGRNFAPAVYAANLVAITEDCQASPPSAWSVAFAMARPHRLRTRIDAILDPTLRRRSPGRAAILAVSFLAVGALTAALTFRLTAAPVEPTSTPEKQDLATLDSQTADTIWTTAREAIRAGDLQTIDSFLKRGFDVNADPQSDASLLFWAVDDHQLDIVKLLLSDGADVNRKTSWGDTPLRRACWRGYKDMADVLIQAGAPVDDLLYATGTGDVVGLEAHDRKQAVTAKQAREAVSFAVASGHENTFDWLWSKLGSLDDRQKEKLLGDLYENAGKWGQTGMLRHLQEMGASPAKYGSRALIKAVSWNYVDAAKYLLDEGVTPNPSTSPFGNMLRNAAGEGRLAMVRLLLDHGADINARDGQNFTPLSWAAHCGQEDVCKLLLERGADGSMEDYEGRNAAWQAAGGEHCPAALERMIKRGVKVTGKDKRGRMILDEMMRSTPPNTGEIAVLHRIYSGSEVAAYDARERQVIELLAAAGADYQGQEGSKTPLMNALETGHMAGARVLINLGANPTTKDQEGNNAIYYLLDRSWGEPLPLDLLETLLNRGADPNCDVHVPGTRPPAASSLLGTALARAATSAANIDGFRRAARMLIAHGAKFSKVADGKAQALLQAAVKGSLPLVQEAIRAGAPVNSVDGYGWDALTVAVALDDEECANWLLANGAVPDNHEVAPWYDVLTFAVERNRADLVAALIARGAKPAGEDGGLSIAIEQGNTRIFEALLKAGANPKGGGNATVTLDKKTFTMHDSIPLYQCIDHGQIMMAKTLLDHGADPDPVNLDHGRNLASWAVIDNRPQILQALLEHGADPTRKDEEADSALSLAQKTHPDMVPMLEAAIKRAQDRDQAADEKDRAIVLRKVESIIVPQVDFHSVRLSDALETLRQEAARLDTEPDPTQRGVNIFLKLPAAAKPAATSAQSAAGTVAPASSSGAAGVTNVAPATPASRLITLHADQWSLLKILRAVGSQIDLKVKVERYAVSLVPSTENTEQLYTAKCIVAAAVFGVPLTPSPTGAGVQPVAIGRVDVQRWLEGKGVTFPPGTSATYLPASQKLIVRNTEENIKRLKVLFPTLDSGG